MRIAFHTPLNDPHDGGYSGDRLMARQLMAMLQGLGHAVEPVLDLRSYCPDPAPERLAAIEQAARTRAAALAADWRAGGAPDLWFTYHSYYKAPDLLGPGLAARYGLPYVVAEASDAGKRANGPWAEHTRLARRSIAAADLHLAYTPRDVEGIAPLLKAGARLAMLPPFLDREIAAPPLPRPPGVAPRLIAIAMMRPGNKVASYLALARAMERLAERPWHLTLIGDGPGRAEVQAAFARFGERVSLTGALPAAAVAAALAAHDLFVWPGVDEAYGLVYLEAQAAGLPVVAFASGGVPETLLAGETGLLVADGDVSGFAEALRRLMDSPELRQAMGTRAHRFVACERDLTATRERLAAALAPLLPPTTLLRTA